MRRRTFLALSGLASSVAAPLLFLAPAPAQAAGTPIGGYTAGVSGTPLSIKVYEPVIPLPAAPQGEADLSYTMVSTSTGPSVRALASSVWPGPAVGDGFGTIAEALGLGEDQEYAVKANATYPSGDHTATTSIGPATTMTASATPKVSAATATTGQPFPVSAVMSAGQSSSKSTTTLGSDRITATSEALAEDIVLAGGLIRIASVRAETTVTSFAESATTAGNTVVTGLTVAGVPFTVDDTGVHAAGQSLPIPGLPTDVATLLGTYGISMSPPEITKEVQGSDASYFARGLQITVDTKPLRTAINDVIPYRALYYQLVGMLPPELQAVVNDPRVPSVVDLGPKVVYEIGTVGALTSASPEFLFQPLPPFTPPAFNPPTTVGPIDPGVPVAQPPALTPPVVGGQPVVPVTPVVAARPLPAPFGGLPGALVVLAIGVGAFFAFGGRRLWYAALPLAGDGCDLGAEVGVPQLRVG